MNTKVLLSDEEANALRASAAESDPQGRAPEGQIVDLHADHWERIASGKAPALESISERMSSLLKITVRRFFRQSVEVNPRPWRDERWGLFARRLPVPTSLNVIEVRGQNVRGVVTLDAQFVFTLVDVFFGGDGFRGDPLLEEIGADESGSAGDDDIGLHHPADTTMSV